VARSDFKPDKTTGVSEAYGHARSDDQQVRLLPRAIRRFIFHSSEPAERVGEMCIRGPMDAPPMIVETVAKFSGGSNLQAVALAILRWADRMHVAWHFIAPPGRA
jgi:hypothetical protein